MSCARPDDEEDRVRAGPVVLVTGGSGVVGRAVVARLKEEGARLRVLDLRRPGPDIEYVTGSILDRERVSAACAGADVVMHLAASLPQARLDEAGFRRVNVEGTVRVAEACVRAGVRRLVFASTIEIYGAQPTPPALTEDAERRFTGVYSRTKWEAEQRLLHYWDRDGLEVAFLRMPMVMGPGFYHEPSTIAVLRCLRAGWPLPVPAPDALVSYVAAADAAQAFALAAGAPGAVGEALNVAAADTPTMADFLAGVVAAVGSRSRLVPVPRVMARLGVGAAKVASRLGGGRVMGTPAELLDFALVGGAYSIDKARRLLGYEPETTCVDAWAATYRWYWDHGPAR